MAVVDVLDGYAIAFGEAGAVGLAVGWGHEVRVAVVLGVVDVGWTLPDVELHFATLGTGGQNGSRLPSTRSIQTLFSRLRQYYELILVDGGSVQSDNYSPVLARSVDGVVLVVEAERTRMPVVDWSLQLLENSKARLLGTVLNKRRYHIPKRVYELM